MTNELSICFALAVQARLSPCPWWDGLCLTLTHKARPDNLSPSRNKSDPEATTIAVSQPVTETTPIHVNQLAIDIPRLYFPWWYDLQQILDC